MSKRPRAANIFSPRQPEAPPEDANDGVPVEEEATEETTGEAPTEFVGEIEYLAPERIVHEDAEVLDYQPSAEELAAMQAAELESLPPDASDDEAPESPHERTRRLGAGYFEDDGHEEAPDIRPDDELPEMAFKAPSDLNEQRLAEFHAGRKARDFHKTRHENEVALGGRMTRRNTDIREQLPDKGNDRHF
ncbi:hypothetical protein [Methylocystis heyeri]|uniref:Uncharacterized protein n=1 Tax=Methylocystis heyeri TaxID=391905 RepID=A0A6B8KEL2_9HYPH|nr:hypothetical protein [Methylocystis heyeri]QGM46127.1 hypothetical protein H2LOC_010710 [Methylocystis heyeri]